VLESRPPRVHVPGAAREIGAIQANEREHMRAGLRLIGVCWAAALLFAPAAAPAQDSNQATTAAPAPAPATVGPQELRNFNLQGNVIRPAEQPPAPRASTPEAPAARNDAATAPAVREPRRRAAAPARRVVAAERPVAAAPEPLRQTAPASSVTVALPRLDNGAVSGSAAAPAAIGALPDAPERTFPLLPWLIAAIALGAGGAFLLWRRRSREALAGGAEYDLFAAPEPVPPPAPSPAPAPAPEPAPERPAFSGLVSTRLRPWIEIGFQPVRCVVEERQVTIDFELELYNSGSIAAQSVLVETNLFNAGKGQDQELGAFFANPAGRGDQQVSIPPLKRMTVKSQVVVARDRVQIFEVAGRKLFVPLVAFNAVYRWTGGGGQTSASYLVGRDTKSDKMAPFRLDLGPRVFRGVGARALPVGVRS
jgi:hypothetical protein